MQHNSLQPQFMNGSLYKNIMIESPWFLVSKKRIELNAFAPIAIGVHNHIHLIWQAMNDLTPSAIQASFMKYTAQQIKLSLMKSPPALLADFKVNKYERSVFLSSACSKFVRIIINSLYI